MFEPVDPSRVQGCQALIDRGKATLHEIGGSNAVRSPLLRRMMEDLDIAVGTA